MELWIRSQDKTKLCQAKYFGLDNDKTGIFCFNGESYSVFAGKYKTKERALEVLDEINGIIQTNKLFEIYSNLGEFPNEYNQKNNLVPVFQMPEE